MVSSYYMKDSMFLTGYHKLQDLYRCLRVLRVSQVALDTYVWATGLAP